MALRIEGTFLLMPLPNQSWAATNYRCAASDLIRDTYGPMHSTSAVFGTIKTRLQPTHYFVGTCNCPSSRPNVHSHMRMIFTILSSFLYASRSDLSRACRHGVELPLRVDRPWSAAKEWAPATSPCGIAPSTIMAPERTPIRTPRQVWAFVHEAGRLGKRGSVT